MHLVKLSTLLVIMALSSCKKDEPVICETTTDPLSGDWLVLNEGLFQQNNSTVTRINTTNGTSTATFFANQAGRPLGDTGNDMKRYGQKIYIIVNVSSTIEVLDATNGSFIKQIPMINNGQGKQPRSIDFKNGNTYVSCFDGYVDVIDTATLTVTKRIAVGNNPDHIRATDSKLYVSNSGGLNFPDVDSTVSVIDLNTDTEIAKIVIGNNPGSMGIGGNGDLYVISRGDYISIPSRMHRISTATDTKIESYAFDASQVTEMLGNIVVFESVGTNTIKTFDVTANSLDASDLIDLSGITTPYKIQFSPEASTFFLFDANGYVNEGYVNAFSPTGAFISKTKVGLVPSSVLTF